MNIDLHSLPESALLREQHLRQIVPLSRSTIWRGIRAGTFPAPVRLSARAVAWRAADLKRWMSERPS